MGKAGSLMDDLSLYRQFGMVPPSTPVSPASHVAALLSDSRTQQALPSQVDAKSLQPSATGRTATTLDDLFSNVPSQTAGGVRSKGDPWGDYMKTMQYLTQPKKDAGPDARRAMAGMPAGPKNAPDDVALKQPAGGQSLMAMLFGGAGK